MVVDFIRRRSVACFNFVNEVGELDAGPVSFRNSIFKIIKVPKLFAFGTRSNKSK